MPEEKPAPVQVRGLQDIAAPGKVPFEFSQNGQKHALEFTPLSAEEVEAIRASIPEPEPPVKPVPGKGARDLKILRQEGYPTTFVDTNDPDYKAALRKREKDLGLEMVRVALRWGPMPWEPETTEVLEAAREGFRSEIQRRMTAGNLLNLTNAVTNRTFALDSGLLERFFGSSRPLTDTSED